MSKASVVLVVAVALAAFVAADEFGPCTFFDSETNAHFDLSRMRLANGASVTVMDILDASQANFQYTYNVCGSALPPRPATAGVNVTCGTTEQTAMAAAYQVNLDNNRCRRLNNDYRNVTWHLLDPLDPTKGVAMTYHGGEPCSARPGVNRQFSLRVHCIENLDTGSNPFEVPRVREQPTCHYGLDVYSPEGCPRECPVNNGQTCSGTGVCGIDTDLNAPRCFCDSYHDGPDCSAEPPSAPTRCDGVCIAMIFLVILLSVLLVVSCVIFWRVQKLEAMNARFSAMTDALPAGANPSERVN